MSKILAHVIVEGKWLDYSEGDLVTPEVVTRYLRGAFRYSGEVSVTIAAQDVTEESDATNESR